MKRWIIGIICLALAMPGALASTPVKASTNLKICMVDYNDHNDSRLNADMTAIQAALPDILIDNTPHGLWGVDGGNNGDCNTIPSKYTALGIHVYSYITAGLEGAEYGDGEEDSLVSNESRIDGIAVDGATGVFMDEVTEFPDSAQQSYVNSIYNRCQIDGLKLIVNVGDNDFNYSFFSSNCDYIMDDEAYSGGNPSYSETGIGLSRCLVTNNACLTSINAISYTQEAWGEGFGWAWSTNNDQYNLPSYLTTYISGLDGYPISIYPAWDVNADGICNYLDLTLVGLYYGETGTPGWIPADINQDGVVNYLDLTILGLYYGQTW